LIFEWDPQKNKSNFNKHKVTFEEAETVFDDINAVYAPDKSHSVGEERFIVIGITEDLEKKLTVCHCHRGDNGDIIRIISARRATKREIKFYEEGFYES